MTKICESFADGFARIGRTLDRQGLSVLAVLEIAEVHGKAEIWRRFGPVRTGIALFSGNPVQPVHDMQIVPSRINTGYFASC